MGLDPFPNTPTFSQRTSFDSILRSKSVNYVDFYLPNLEKAQNKAQQEAQEQAHHCRVRTSVSFRDVGPTFLDPQNHELLILCLDQVDEISRKAELSLKEMVRKIKEEKPNNKVIIGPYLKPKIGNGLCEKRDVEAKPSANLNRKSRVRPTVSRKEKSGELKPKRARENDRSPNSRVRSSCVLHHDFPVRIEAQMSDNLGPNLSKKSPTRFNKYDYPCPDLTSRLKENDHQELKAIKSKTNKTSKSSKLSKYLEVDNMLMEVCSLTEEDTKKGSVWMVGKDYLKLEKIEEMCFELGQEVLEMLLCQLVDELCGFS